MDLWNDRNLKAPLSDFCPYSVNEARKLGNVANLVETLNSAAKEFGPQNVLWAEIKLFQAIKKRIALSQSSDKFLKAMQQVDHCIRNLIHMNMSKVFQDLARNFIGNVENSTVIHFPSRQQLEFVLIQCQGASKLLCQSQNYIFSAFSYLVQTLGIGHVLQKLLMACAVISRINTMLKYLLHVTCNTYRELTPWLDKLKKGSWKWEQSLSLPDDIWTFLEPEDLKLYRNKVSCSTLPFLGEMFDSEKQEVTSPSTYEKEPDEVVQEDMDLGEVVSRDLFEEAAAPSVKASKLARRQQKEKAVKMRKEKRKEMSKLHSKKRKQKCKKNEAVMIYESNVK